tara:strand:- start:2148 stop:4013 length:1866 start_codon:yes stop_codon:yes gene_type:complete
MRKYFPIILSFLFLSISILLWDKIKLPYDAENLIVGEHFFKKNNPQNDLIRFLFLLVPSVSIYLISYLKINKSTYSFNKNAKDYFLNNLSKGKENKILNKYFFFFVILVVIEFLTINFENFLNIDTFHDSVFLTPPINYLNNQNFFQSTLYDYGFIGNNLGLIFNSLFGFFTLGSINFIKLILILLIKLSLILISKRIIDFLDYDEFFKKLFFILFTITLLCLPNYYDFTSYFSPRSILYLFLILLIGSALCTRKFREIKFFTIGTFSLLSLFWWFDIGIYINILLIFLSIYLIVETKKKNLFFLLFGLFSSWVVFFIAAPSDEIKDFIYNIKFIIFTTDYLIGTEYLKPFSEGSTRWTKALIIIFISSIILVNLNFSKKLKLNAHLKIYLNLIFISGIIIFNSALTRSDVYHLKYSSGFYSLIFIFIIYFFLFTYFNNNKNINAFLKKKRNKIKQRFILIISTILSGLFLLGYLNDKNSISIQQKLSNLINFNLNIKKLITTSSKDYLQEREILALEKYKLLSSDDKCVQYFADDNFFPFFLKKPTCTKFYLSNQILTDFTEKEFISEFKKSMPNIILYDSPTKLMLNYDNLQEAMKFVRDNYEFYENFNGYIFYKKIDS